MGSAGHEELVKLLITSGLPVTYTDRHVQMARLLQQPETPLSLVSGVCSHYLKDGRVFFFSVASHSLSSPPLGLTAPLPASTPGAS